MIRAVGSARKGREDLILCTMINFTGEQSVDGPHLYHIDI